MKGKLVRGILRRASIVALLLLFGSCHMFDREESGLSNEDILALLALTTKYSCASSAWVPGGAFLFGADRKRPVYAPGELLVTFRENVPPEGRAASLKGMTAGRTSLLLEGHSIHRVSTSRGETVDDAVERLRLDPNVLSVQPNFRYYATNIPTDPGFSNQWGLQNNGQTVNGIAGVSGVDIGATTAWNTRTDCSSIVVAVLDSGVNYNQEDLAASMWDDGSGNHGYDFIRGTSTPMDYNGHGTHVAGIIGAAGNATGGVGVCRQAKIMAVRVLDATGGGDSYTIAEGIRWAVDHGARVINASLGGSGGYSGDVMDQAIAYARQHGVLFVVAAGNEASNNDTTGSYPANYDQGNIISVAAIDSRGSLATYSNYGEHCVHVGAPGSNIYSTWAGTTKYNGSTTRGTLTSDYFPTGATAGFQTPWNVPGLNWGHAPQAYSGGSYYEIMNPPSSLATNQWWKVGLSPNTGVAYAVLVATGYAEPYVTFYADYEFVSSDWLSFKYGTTNAAPTTDVDLLTGSTGGGLRAYGYDLASRCGNQANCSLGFQMHATTGGGVPYGAGIAFFEFVGTKVTDTNIYAYESGTSMAAPYVTGLAALVWAEHPGASYADVRRAILNGGTTLSSLQGRTTTGKMISAPGALSGL